MTPLPHMKTRTDDVIIHDVFAPFARTVEWFQGTLAPRYKKVCSTVKVEGDTLTHTYTGEVLAVRVPGVVYIAGTCIADTMSPAFSNARSRLIQAASGEFREYRYRWSRGPDNGDTRDRVYRWEVGALVVAVPPSLLQLAAATGGVSSTVVDYGTRMEHARVQRLIHSRSKAIPKKGKVPYFLAGLVDNAESAGEGTGAVRLDNMNALRHTFDLEPLPAFTSPIPGLGLEDYANLVTLSH